jgi:nitrite reductase (NADH) large subunit
MTAWRDDAPRPGVGCPSSRTSCTASCADLAPIRPAHPGGGRPACQHEGIATKKWRLVLIGNGMAGVRSLEELLKIAPDLHDITVFGAEPHPNYKRMLLSPVLAGEQTIEQIVLNPLAWCAERGITLHLSKTVTEIDHVKRRVIASDGTVADHDRLLIATGSTPFILPVPGKDLQGVIAYRDIADRQAKIDTTTKYRPAVVIGGGLLGLEAANGLMLRGMQITVVHVYAEVE